MGGSLLYQSLHLQRVFYVLWRGFYSACSKLTLGVPYSVLFVIFSFVEGIRSRAKLQICTQLKQLKSLISGESSTCATGDDEFRLWVDLSVCPRSRLPRWVGRRPIHV